MMSIGMTPLERTPSRQEGDPAESAWITGVVDARLTRAIDLGLTAAVGVVPFAMGGRQAVGQLVLSAVAFWLATAWGVRQSLRKNAVWNVSGTEFLMPILVLLVLFQLVPLPSAVLSCISPHLARILPLWMAPSTHGISLGGWRHVTLDPAATRGALSVLLAYILIFSVGFQHLRKLTDIERLLKRVAAAGGLMALFGIVQYLTSNGKFFWIYEHPFSRTTDFVKGAFTNRNHFAQFLALAIGPLIWWGASLMSAGQNKRPRGFRLDKVRREFDELKIGSVLFTLGIVVFVGLLTLSRGGALAMFASIITCLVILYRAAILNGRVVTGLIAMGGVAGACLLIHGHKQVEYRLSDMLLGGIEGFDQGDGRRNIWSAAASAFADFPWCGTGIGTHREVNPLYYHFLGREGLEFTHAENSYLQIGVEAGSAGLLLAACALGLCTYWCLAALRRNSSPRAIACLGAVAGSLVASIVHAVGDFVWYVPGCMTIVMLMLAAACRLAQLPQEEAGLSKPARAMPRFAWWIGSGVVVGLGAWMLSLGIGLMGAEFSWNKYLTLALHGNHDPSDKRQLHALHKAEIAALKQTLCWTPDNARAHARLAQLMLRVFDQMQDASPNPMTLEQIRDAAIASRFDSRKSLDAWLERAIGKNRKFIFAAEQHARRAIELCPLQGEVYVYLAELCFLERVAPEAKADLVAQAVAVRPNDGWVLFQAGKEAILAGDMERNLRYWKQSFNRGQAHRHRIYEYLVGHVAAEFILQNFQPGWEGLGELAAYYRRRDAAKELPLVLRKYEEALIERAEKLDDEAGANAWLAVAEVQAELRENAVAGESLKRALACDENSFPARQRLATWLVLERQFDAAEPHLNWCQLRKPEDAELQKLLQTAAAERMRGPLMLH